MFNTFTRLVSEASLWTYAVVMIFALLDAIIPVVPSEATVITAGVVAATGDLSLPVVIVAAGVGAWLGDNTAYWLGRRFGERVTQRFFRGEKARKRLDWTERQLDERGGELVAVGRFIPGGRTAVTLSAGLLLFPWRRFAAFDALAAAIWATYAGLLGYLGGHVFEDAPWKGLLLAFGLAIAVGGAVEGGRWWLRRGARGRTDAAGSDEG
jgi:membrane-associated protein